MSVRGVILVAKSNATVRRSAVAQSESYINREIDREKGERREPETRIRINAIIIPRMFSTKQESLLGGPDEMLFIYARESLEKNPRRTVSISLDFSSLEDRNQCTKNASC